MLDWMLNTLYELFHLILMTFLLVRLPPFQMKKTEAWKSSIAVVTWEHIFSDNDIQTIMWGEIANNLFTTSPQALGNDWW